MHDLWQDEKFHPHQAQWEAASNYEPLRLRADADLHHLEILLCLNKIGRIKQGRILRDPLNL